MAGVLQRESNSVLVLDLDQGGSHWDLGSIETSYLSMKLACEEWNAPEATGLWSLEARVGKISKSCRT